MKFRSTHSNDVSIETNIMTILRIVASINHAIKKKIMFILWFRTGRAVETACRESKDDHINEIFRHRFAALLIMKYKKWRLSEINRYNNYNAIKEIWEISISADIWDNPASILNNLPRRIKRYGDENNIRDWMKYIESIWAWNISYRMCIVDIQYRHVPYIWKWYYRRYWKWNRP